MRAALRRMIVDAGLELAVGREVKRLMGWTLSDEAARDRVLQCLSGRAPRNFDIDWIVPVMRMVIAAGGQDLVTPLIAEAVYQGRRDAEALELGERRGPVRVRREAKGA